MTEKHSATSSIPVERTTSQRLGFAGAVIFVAAPIGFGVYRYLSTGWDLRMFWMALVASVFAAGVLASAIGKRRSRHQVLVQSLIIVLVGAAVAVGTAKLLGPTEGPGVWMVGAVLGILLGIASELIAFARVKPH